MQKFVLGSCFIVATLILSGCGGGDTDTTGDMTTNTTSGSGMFSIASCNSYVDIMNCIIEKSPAEAKTGSQSMFDKIIAAWKQLDNEQLTQACNATMEVMTKQKDTLKQMGCEIK